MPERDLVEAVLELAAPLLQRLGPDAPIDDARAAIALAVTRLHRATRRAASSPSSVAISRRSCRHMITSPELAQPANRGRPRHPIDLVGQFLNRLRMRPWAGFVVGDRKEIVLALDWTEFDADDHATLAGYLITSHGRATPLIWMTVRKSTLAVRARPLGDAYRQHGPA